MSQSKLTKSQIINSFKSGIIFTVKLPYKTIIKPSNLTKTAAAAVGGSKGVFMINNTRERDVEILTEIQFTSDGLLIKNAKGDHHHLIIHYTDIKSVKLNSHSLEVLLVNNMVFKFEIGMLQRVGLKRSGTNSKFVLQVLHDYLIRDYKYY